MMPARCTRGSKWLAGSLAALLLTLGPSATSFADLRIVDETSGDRTETLIKNGRVVSHFAPGDWIMIDCARGELTFVSSPHYWQGSIAEFAAELKALQAEISRAMAAGADTGGFWGGLPGSQATGTSQVRITELGDEAIAGYRATRYQIETGDGSRWQAYESLWISRDLLQDIQAEIGPCSRVLTDLSQQLTALVPMGDAQTVHSDPAYRALFERGFPVRSVTKVSVLGLEMEVESQVVEVSRAPLDEAHFTVPSALQKLDSLSDAFELGD